jgi:hypothetical protein
MHLQAGAIVEILPVAPTAREVGAGEHEARGVGPGVEDGHTCCRTICGVQRRIILSR